jgi:cobalt-zinc-cadmium efflux system membrane fusion protein
MKALQTKTLVPALVAVVVLLWFVFRDAPDHTHAPGVKSVPAEMREPELGPHGGELFVQGDLSLELELYEKSGQPRFRAYPTTAGKKPVDPKEVELTLDLTRLGGMETIHFQPEHDHLLGQAEVREPHSFAVKIQARWKGKPFVWQTRWLEAQATLSEQAMRIAGIETTPAGPGNVRQIIRLLGEVGLDEHRIAHVVPRVDGVVKTVHKHLGENIHKGEVLAVLESRELADAKSVYYEAVSRRELARLDLDRQQKVSQNTTRMLELLDRKLDLGQIHTELAGLDIGDHREQMLSAYAKLELARTVLEREKDLHEKKISSRAEYLAALEGHQSAEARFLALHETIAFQIQRDKMTAEKSLKLADVDIKRSYQKLLAFGLTPEAAEAVVQEDRNGYTRYEMLAPADGTLVEKKIHIGEAVKKDENIFLVADLSRVRVNLSIPEKELRQVHLRQKVIVGSEQMRLTGEGTISYIGSTMREATRSVTGFVLIDNPERLWRPGLFVTVDVVREDKTVPLAVPQSALQMWRGRKVVFVKYGDRFEPRPVILGSDDGQWAEVVQGLAAGDLYVSKNSFAVKAEIEKEQAVHE